MLSTLVDQIRRQLADLDPSDTAYATEFVGALLDAACEAGTSDIHLTPNGNDLDVRWRLDGVLQSVGHFPSGQAADIVSRLISAGCRGRERRCETRARR